jgi:hypothetical protein
MLRFFLALALVAAAQAQTSVVGEGGGGASDLDALTDVTLTSETTDDALKYDGSGWVNTTALSLHGLTVYDDTATTGSTTAVFRAGAGQATAPLLEFKTAAGSTVSKIDHEGNLDISSSAKFLIGGGTSVRAQGAAWNVSNNHLYRWSSTSSASGPHDLSMYRYGPAELQLGDGGANANGKLRAAGVTAGYVALADPGSKPACDASQRGKIWYDEGGAGVADSAEICGKDASDVYAWVAIATF